MPCVTHWWPIPGVYLSSLCLHSSVDPQVWDSEIEIWKKKKKKGQRLQKVNNRKKTLKDETKVKKTNVINTVTWLFEACNSGLLESPFRVVQTWSSRGQRWRPLLDQRVMEKLLPRWSSPIKVPPEDRSVHLVLHIWTGARGKTVLLTSRPARFSPFALSCSSFTDKTSFSPYFTLLFLVPSHSWWTFSCGCLLR